ncbi:MAG: substrate-binding domain-containing protein [Acutalibacteraceae bacterium]
MLRIQSAASWTTCLVETIRQIFAGEIATWDQVDSTLPAEAINVYIRDLSGGAYEVFQKSVMGDSEVTASATQSASMTELATNIAGDKWGIGYAGFGAYNKA